MQVYTLDGSSTGCKFETESVSLPRRRFVYALLADIGRHLGKEEWLGRADRDLLDFERAPVLCGKRDHHQLVPVAGKRYRQNGGPATSIKHRRASLLTGSLNPECRCVRLHPLTFSLVQSI